MKTAKELRLAEPATSAGLLCWVTAHADEPVLVMRAWHQLGLLFEEGRRLDAARACFEEGARRGSRLCLIWQAQAALAAAPPRAEEAAALLRWAVDGGFGDDVDHDEARLALARLALTRPDLVPEEEVLHHLLPPLHARVAKGRVLRAHLTLERKGRAAEAEAVYLDEAQAYAATAEAAVRLALLRGEVPPASPPHRWAQVLFAEQLFLEAEGAMRASAVDLLRSLVGHDDDTGRRAALTLAIRCHFDEEAAGRPAPVSRAEALDVLRRLAAVEPPDDWVLRARRIVSGG
ncbi:MAG: hypothetical protein KF878_37910 [Planctomycetes bacterium]|nr:hypothetical protein [Planctomycetota bacterium]